MISLSNPLYRLGAELVVLIALVCGALWYRHVLIQEGVQQELRSMQSAEDRWKGKVDEINRAHDEQIKKVHDAHAKEMSDIAEYYNAHPVTRIVLRAAPAAGPVSNSGTGAEAAVAGGAVPQQDVGVHPDIGPALAMLFRQADTLLANCRQAVAVNEVNAHE